MFIAAPVIAVLGPIRRFPQRGQDGLLLPRVGNNAVSIFAITLRSPRVPLHPQRF
jgi:hypothetical protein